MIKKVIRHWTKCAVPVYAVNVTITGSKREVTIMLDMVSRPLYRMEEVMNLNELSRMVIRLQKYKSMTDPYRFVSTKLHQEAIPEYYAPDPSMFTKSPAERAASIIEKTDATDILTALLSGGPVDSDMMLKTIGVSHETFMNYMNDIKPVKKPVPDKTVVLTFDDAKKDHVTHAAPLLKELGFNATFCVTEMQPENGHAGFEDKKVFMTWDEIATLDAMGFEIANHTLSHKRPDNPLDKEAFMEDMNALDKKMEEHGIPKSVSVAYPFGMCSKDQMECAASCGKKWGRGNLPEGINGSFGKTYYDPLTDHPLAMPSFGDSPLYDLNRLKERLSLAKDGHVLCLAYHSVLDPGEWGNPMGFEEYFRAIADAGYHCIAMRDLSEYIDPDKAAAYTSI